MRLLFSGFLLLALSSAASAQAPDAERQIRDALQRAENAGVPVALLESKVAEGRAKGVPLERIAQAVERRLETLQLVRSQMRSAQLVEAELGLAADAVQAGVGTALLLRLAETAPREQRAAAMAALSQLVQLGFVPEDALQRVGQALREGPAALMNLPAQAAAARARNPAAGGPPPNAGPPGGNGPPGLSKGRGPPGGAPPRGKPEDKKPKPPKRGG